MYLYKTTIFPHQPLRSISKVAVLHRFDCNHTAGYSIYYKTACTTSEDQPTYWHIQIRVFAGHSVGQPRIQSAFRRIAKTDQSVQKHRLIYVFTGRSCNIGIAVPRLSCKGNRFNISVDWNSLCINRTG